MLTKLSTAVYKVWSGGQSEPLSRDYELHPYLGVNGSSGLT